MDELRDLYQEVILDHNKNPRNYGSLRDADHTAAGSNPLCGDKMKLFLKLKDGAISEIAFEGSGCAISKSSASIMTETVKGMAASDIEALFEKVHGTMVGESTADDLGKLAVFSGVQEFPARVKCATLAWHTLKAALADSNETVTTE